MPVKEITTSDRQKNFFRQLEKIHLILSGKKTFEHPFDAWAVNLHGNFYLFLKDWCKKFPKKNYQPETLLALAEAEPVADDKEPAVHLHADWEMVRWAYFNEKIELEKVGTTCAISFHPAQGEPQLFTFYGNREEVKRLFPDGPWVNLWP